MTAESIESLALENGARRLQPIVAVVKQKIFANSSFVVDGLGNDARHAAVLHLSVIRVSRASTKMIATASFTLRLRHIFGRFVNLRSGESACETSCAPGGCRILHGRHRVKT
jgi:hypothetical protein